MPIMAFIVVACTSTKQGDYSVVPLPQEVSVSQATPFKLGPSTVIAYPKGDNLLKRNAEFLSEYVAQATGYTLAVKESEGEAKQANSIVLCIAEGGDNAEGYTLTTTSDQIRICGQSANGVFYGIQTLRKAIPAQAQGAAIILPAGEVKDAPRFGYRGMHLDVGRHFFPVDFIKKYIDLLALHNMNTLHWHLTEDQGWRVEIKKYPGLTEIGSKRKETVIGRNSGKYDGTPYGGFYTQEECRDVVAYAAERYITVIPEIDLPGHMQAALAAYPELGCTGGPYEVWTKWGISDDVLCLGNPKVIPFLEDVLTEILDIFPSSYIHIGGDEAPRVRWKSCPKCQALIRKEHLKADKEHTAEDRLQSYCMARIEKFLNEKGRRVIGWDEILEGDIAPNATVMSWRGSAGGIKAAQMGHDVIMTPNSHCYFDYYQTDNTKNEPLAIGGHLPIERVYSLEPTAQLTPEQATHILGVQANLWTEYIATTEYVEYMILPRMAALAEVQWTQPEKKNYNCFGKRLARLLQFYKRDGLNYAKHAFNIKSDFKSDTEARAVNVTLSVIDDAPVYYTLDGTEPTTSSQKYTAPISIKENAELRAIVVRNGEKTEMSPRSISFNKATLCPIEMPGAQPTARYTFKGAPTLVDGMKGKEDFQSGAWLGFLGGAPEFVIDLGQNTEIQRVAIETLVAMNDWISGCAGLKVEVSDDKNTFREVATQQFAEETQNGVREIRNYEATFSPVQARYVKITASTSILPQGHGGAGKPAFLFIDEICVE